MRILVIRTSAMGDVALTVPALVGMRKQYPAVEIILVTQARFVPFFVSVQGLKFVHPDFKGRHKGFFGLIRLFREIKRMYNPEIVLDLHDVLRSAILSSFFRFSGTPVFKIDKGRSDKRKLVNGTKKEYLKHAVERYCDVFRNSGFKIEPEKGICIKPGTNAVQKIASLKREGGLNIGVAPFAKHRLKMWPVANMEALLKLISENYRCRFFLFGGREDSTAMAQLKSKLQDCTDVSVLQSLDEEIALISILDFMIAMDSSNMHMSALCGTKVISIWGGTDPMAGFGPWMQPDSMAVRVPVEELDCRPCTVYGKGSSRRGLECMKRLTPGLVFRRMLAMGVFGAKGRIGE